jgi:AcrR family transcriptional regulator
MPRSGDQARLRLRAAALELYREHGYDSATTAQIAERAGVSARTYFRHFPDKREVLFDGELELRRVMTEAVENAPSGLAPLPLVLRAYDAAVPLLVANRPVAEQRAAIIATTPALQERAHAKAAALLAALTVAVEARGVPAETARLAAQVGAAVFDRASRAWAAEPDRDLRDLLAESLAATRELG